MFITQLVLCRWVFLSGFYEICLFSPFLEHFWTECCSWVFPELLLLFLLSLSLWHSWLCPSGTRKQPSFQSNSCSPSTPIKQALFIELWGAKSVTHSVTHINLLPRCPLRLWPCSPNTISLSKPDEKTYDHLNKHRHSMAPLSVRRWGRVSFMWCMCVRACESTCLRSLCSDIIAVRYFCTWTCWSVQGVKWWDWTLCTGSLAGPEQAWTCPLVCH